MTAARNSVEALIGFLKNQLQQSIFSGSTDNVKTRQWLERFTALDDNPRAARIMGAGSPYSIGTIEMYREVYKKHIKDDPFCQLKMCEVEQTHCLAFMTRLGMKEKDKCRGGGPIAGTRTYEITLRFVRMAFKEYAETHETWRNPFDRIKPPRSKTPRERDILETWEIKKLFEPGVIQDPLDRALAAAMFWAGMRRGEIYGLMPEDLNWRIPCIVIRNAWQNYGRKKKRLGDPKWHKTRRIAFPIQLQEAIHELWATYGEHKFVFCNREGKLPGAKYLQHRLPRWIKAAGIDLGGRDIVPHGSRHSLASALEDSGVSLRQIQDMLGHSDLKTTKHYLHDTANHINKMGGKIGDLAKQETNVIQFNDGREGAVG
jgi:integrase